MRVSDKDAIDQLAETIIELLDIEAFPVDPPTESDDHPCLVPITDLNSSFRWTWEEIQTRVADGFGDWDESTTYIDVSDASEKADLVACYPPPVWTVLLRVRYHALGRLEIHSVVRVPAEESTLTRRHVTDQIHEREVVDFICTSDHEELDQEIVEATRDQLVQQIGDE